METHPIHLKTEKKDILLPHWDRGAWDEFPASVKLKSEFVAVSPIIEQVNKPACFTPDNIIIDKSKVIREFYKCEQCQETVTSKQMLKQHKDSVHNDKKTFRCSVGNCVRAFTSANYLKNHIDIEHTDCSEARIPCPKKDCGLFFPNNYRLKRHIRQDHRQEKLYHCQICARKFASLEVRNNHMKAKHGSLPLRDSCDLKMKDGNYFRTDPNKESENDTVYAASPISSRFGSVNEQSSIDTTCEAQWLTKTCDSNPPLSKQIDRILCDIFSDKYQETIHSPLNSSELAIAIVSLEEANDDGKRKQVKGSPHFNSIISDRSSPLKSNYLFNDFDRKLSTSHNRLTSSQYNFHNGTSQMSQNNMNSMALAAQNYPQSNTESEGHSTESQRSFFVNSSQHEEFSEISMESHLKDVFSNTVDKWNGYGPSTNIFENPIKLLEYTCLDTMFDDFHDIITSDHVTTNPYMNGHTSLLTNIPTLPGQKNHLLSLNNMHSKFLGGSQFNHIDFPSNRPNPNNVPSNQITTLSNYEINRRKMNNCFPNKKMHPGPYDINSPYNKETNMRDSFAMEISPRYHGGPAINGPMIPQDGIKRMNYAQNYPCGTNQQMMNSNHMYYNRDPSALYIQQQDRPPYPICLNGSVTSNPLYQNSIDSDFINEPMSQATQYPTVFRRRAPPVYQAGFSHQMLPAQHPGPSAASYCPPPSIYRNNNYFHNRTMFTDTPATTSTTHSNYGIFSDTPAMVTMSHSNYGVITDTPALNVSTALSNTHHRQQSQMRHLSSQQPMINDFESLRDNHVSVNATTDNNPFSEYEETIVSEEQSSSVTSNEPRSHTIHSASSVNVLDHVTPNLSLNCDNGDVKATLCM